MKAEEFVEAGSDSFLVHWEGNNNLHRTLQRIKGLGKRVGKTAASRYETGIELTLEENEAMQRVEDDHMNIVSMGGRTVGPAVAWDLVQTFWPPN
jgi:hypothetical protein